MGIFLKSPLPLVEPPLKSELLMLHSGETFPSSYSEMLFYLQEA